MSDEPEPTMRLAAGRCHVVSVCPCAGCTHTRELVVRTMTRRLLEIPWTALMRPILAPEPMVLEEGTPGALARFGARLIAEGFGAPLHPEWHPSHREIL